MAEKQKAVAKKTGEEEMKKLLENAMAALNGFTLTGDSQKKDAFLKIWNENKKDEKFVERIAKALNEDELLYNLRKAYKDYKGKDVSAIELIIDIEAAHKELANKTPNYSSIESKFGEEFVSALLDGISKEAFERLEKFVLTGEKQYKEAFLRIWEVHKHRKDFVDSLFDAIKSEPKIFQLYGAYVEFIGAEVPPRDFLDAVSTVYTELEKKSPNYDWLYETYGNSFVERARVTKQLKPVKMPPEEFERKQMLEETATNVGKVSNKLKILEKRIETDPSVFAAKEVLEPQMKQWKKWVKSATTQDLGKLSTAELKEINENMKKINAEMFTDSELNVAARLSLNFVKLVQTGNANILTDFQNAFNSYQSLSKEKKETLDKIVELQIKAADEEYNKGVKAIVGVPSTEEEMEKLSPEKKVELDEKLKMYSLNLYDFVMDMAKKEAAVSPPGPLPAGELSTEMLAGDSIGSLKSYMLTGSSDWKKRFLLVWDSNKDNAEFKDAFGKAIVDSPEIYALIAAYIKATGRSPGGAELCEAISEVKNRLKTEKEALVTQYGEDFVSLIEKTKEPTGEGHFVETLSYITNNVSFVYKQINQALSMQSIDNAADLKIAKEAYEAHFGKDYTLLNYSINFPALKQAFGVATIEDLAAWLKDNKDVSEAKTGLNLEIQTYGNYKDSNNLWGGLGAGEAQEKQRIITLQNKLSVTDSIMLANVMDKLSGGEYGYSKQTTTNMVVDGVLLLSERDAYLIPSYLENVIKPLAKSMKSEEDFQKALAAVNVFIETRYNKSGMMSVYARLYFLDRFEMMGKLIPKLGSTIGHEEIFAETWEKPGNYETHPYYKVKEPFLFGKDAFTIPMYNTQPYSLSLLAPGVPSMPGDPNRLVWGLDFFPGAKTEYDWLYGQLYPPYDKMFKPAVPPYYTIGGISAERVMKELSAIFGVMPAIPYSSKFLGAALEAGAYAGGSEKGTGPSWELGAKGAGTTPTGGVAGEVIGGKLEKEGHILGEASGGGLKPGIHNFTVKGEWKGTEEENSEKMDTEYWEALAQSYSAIAKDQKADMLVYFYGFGAPVPGREENMDGLKTGVDGLKEAILSGNDTAMTSAVDSLRDSATALSWDSHAQSDLNGYLDNMEAALASGDNAAFATAADSFEKRVNKIDPDLLRLKGKLYFITKNGDTYQVAYGKDTETEFMNYLFGEADTKNVYGSVKMLGKEMFKEEAQLGGFNGAALGITIPAKKKGFAAAGLGEAVPTLKGEKMAYEEVAAGVSVSKLYSEGDVTIGIFRGSSVPTFKKGEQAYSGELIHKKLALKDKNEAAYEIRLLGGNPLLIGAGLMTENVIYPGVGAGIRGGYGEFNLNKYYSLLDTESAEIYTKAKNLLVNAYAWKKEEADKIGWFLAGTYMYSNIEGMYSEFNEEGVLESGQTEELKHFGMGLLMLWSKKHNFMAGVAKAPGFLSAMDIIDQSLVQIGQNPDNQENIIKGAIDQINGVMKYDIWKAALGYGYDSQGKFKTYILGSAELNDKTYAWGNLRGLIFFNDKVYSDTMATLYTYQKSTYMDLFSGLGFPLTVEIGTPTIVTNKGAQKELEAEKMLKFANEVKAQFVGVVAYSSTSLTEEDAKSWDVMLSSKLLSKPKESSGVYYARVAEWAEEGKKGTIEIGGEDEAKAWSKAGFLVQKIKLGEKDGKLAFRFPDAGADATLFNKMKIMGGPTFGILEATKYEAGVQKKELGMEFRGFSAQWLLHILQTNKDSIIAGVVYGQKEYAEATATSEFKKKLTEWQVVLVGTNKKPTSAFETKEAAYYFMVDYQTQTVTVGTADDFKEWKIIAGVDWGKINLEGEAETFKLLFIFGQKNIEKASGVGTETTKVKKWIAAGGLAYEKASPSITFTISGMGGYGPYPTQFGPHSIWDYGVQPFSPYSTTKPMEEQWWILFNMGLKW
ncbi:hypothetical protein H0O02_01120 [Candidatus Micrarchaeota archaeon]|nr:hypothetical protein [Candidatus Micrarchaeota archaeon]